MNRIYALVFIVVVFAGCSSLPFPHTAPESLLIVSCEIDQDAPPRGEEIKSLSLLFLSKEMGTSKEYTMKVPMSGEWGVMKVDPGKFILTSAVVSTSETKVFGKKQEETVDIGREISIQPRTVHLMEERCILSADGANGYQLQLAAFHGEAEQTNVYRALAADPRWPGWERYRLVNFPEDVESSIDEAEVTKTEG
mgnify:FL=1